MFAVAFLSIIALKLGRIGTSFIWNQTNQSFSVKWWKCVLMMLNVWFITRLLAAGWKSGTCQITTWEEFTTQFTHCNYTLQGDGKVPRIYLIWICPLQLMQRFTCLNTECVPVKAQDCPFPGARVVYLSIFCQLCQELIHIFQRIARLKLLKYTVN